MFWVTDAEIDTIIHDDLPYGDETTALMGIGGEQGSVQARNKTQGMVCGIELAARAFERLGATVVRHAKDGETLEAQTPLLTATGSVDALHGVYKMAQVIMEYTSGIARRVDAMRQAAQAQNPDCQIALTRKHFPGAKTLSLYAARLAGASIHRTSLSESILVFDQHRVFLDNPLEVVSKMKKKRPERRVIVEVDSTESAMQYVGAGADIIQCERFAPDELAKLVCRVKAEAPAVNILAAGGINATNAGEYAATGIDAIVTSWPYWAQPADVKMIFERKH